MFAVSQPPISEPPPPANKKHAYLETNLNCAPRQPIFMLETRHVLVVNKHTTDKKSHPRKYAHIKNILNTTLQPSKTPPSPKKYIC